MPFSQQYYLVSRKTRNFSNADVRIANLSRKTLLLFSPSFPSLLSLRDCGRRSAGGGACLCASQLLAVVRRWLDVWRRVISYSRKYSVKPQLFISQANRLHVSAKIYSHHQADFAFVEPDGSYIFRLKHVDYFFDKQIVDLG